MSIQLQLSEKFLVRYTNSIVKKIDRDNHLDIYIPEIHEKKGTHVFFNTAKDKIKDGFYCRDEEFVSNILVNNGQGEGYLAEAKFNNTGIVWKLTDLEDDEF